MQDIPMFEELSSGSQATLMLGRKVTSRPSPLTGTASSVEFDEELFGLIPPDLMLRYRSVPLSQRSNVLVLGMVNPDDVIAIDDFRLITGFDIEPVAIPDFEFAAVAAHFGSEVDPSPNPDCVLAMTGLHVRAQIVGPIANVLVRQTFHNPLDEMIEAVYIFPLSPRAAVHQFRMQLGDRVVEGEVQEKSQARQTYKTGLRQGHRAALVEQQRDNVFTTTIGNIPPGETLSLELCYAERLEMDECDTTFRFPLVVAPRYFPGSPLPTSQGLGSCPDTTRVPDASLFSPPLLPPGLRQPGSLSMELEITHGGVGLAGLTSTQHAVSAQIDANRTVVKLSREDEALNRDFVVRYRLGQEASNLLMTDGDTFMLCLTPPSAADQEVLPRDVVLILDRSGSMDGPKMQSARRAAQSFLGHLGPEDRFALMAFDHELEPYRSGFLQPSSQIGNACQWLDSIDARGGTEILRSIQWLVDLARSVGPERHVSAVLITDGQVGNEAEIYRYLRVENPPLRLYTLGVDSAVNEAFLRQMARVGRGTCELVTPGDPLEQALDRLAREVSCPLVSDIEVLDGGLNPKDLTPDPIPDLYACRPLVLLGRCSGEGDLIVRGLQGRQEFSARVTAQTCLNPALPLLWAREKIQTLQDRLALGDCLTPLEVQQEITDLALDYGLVSDYTSFVLVDREQVVDSDGQYKTVVQPVEAPAQWGSDVDCTVKDISAQDFGPLDFEDEEIALDRLKEMVDEAPIVRLVKLILSQAIKDSANVIYIVPEPKSVCVEFEIDGRRHDVMSPPLHILPALIARLKSLAGLDLDIHHLEQSGHLTLTHDHSDYRIGITITLSPEGREGALITIEPPASTSGLTIAVTGR